MNLYRSFDITQLEKEIIIKKQNVKKAYRSGGLSGRQTKYTSLKSQRRGEKNGQKVNLKK